MSDITIPEYLRSAIRQVASGQLLKHRPIVVGAEVVVRPEEAYWVKFLLTDGKALCREVTPDGIVHPLLRSDFEKAKKRTAYIGAMEGAE